MVEFKDGDFMMVHHNIGNITSSVEDEYCTKILKFLDDIFGKNRVALFPTRDGEDWEFTIIRKI